MSNKREERRRRSEEAKEARALAQEAARRRATLMKVAAVAGVLGLVAIGYVATQRNSAPPGKVWSAAHGHWHDR